MSGWPASVTRPSTTSPKHRARDAVATMRWMLAPWLRNASIKAPISAPTPSDDISKPNPAGPVSISCLASSGIQTLKLMPKTPDEAGEDHQIADQRGGAHVGEAFPQRFERIALADCLARPWADCASSTGCR